MSSSSSSSSNKKMKKDDGVLSALCREKEHVAVLRRHILSCTELDGDSRAVKAALNGLDKEAQRIDRDEKLYHKFSTKTTTTVRSYDESTTTEIRVTDDRDRKQERRPPMTKPDDDDDEEEDSELTEWQDVRTPSSAVAADEESVLGRTLAQAAIATLAREKVRVSGPLSALTVALHSALTSPPLNFECTGVPDDDDDEHKKQVGGFATSIRALRTFLPPDFDHGADADATTQRLRYRKSDTGAVLLRLSSQWKQTDESSSQHHASASSRRNDDEATHHVKVEFFPTSTTSSQQQQPEPSGQLLFPITDHVNLDSFVTALKSERKRTGNKSSGSHKILPTLHYKRLALLLSNFVKTVDLGDVTEEHRSITVNVNSTPIGSTSNDSTTMSTTAPNNKPTQPPRIVVQPQLLRPCRVVNEPRIPTIHDLVPSRTTVAGDFDADLLPGGGGGMLVSPPPPPSDGNLMGPDHAFFQRGPNPYDDDDNDNNFGGGMAPPTFGGLGMRPRFDAIHGGPRPGPLGGGRGGGRGERGNGRRGTKGEYPNPDHMRPPNSNNYGDMFM